MLPKVLQWSWSRNDLVHQYCPYSKWAHFLWKGFFLLQKLNGLLLLSHPAADVVANGVWYGQKSRETKEENTFRTEWMV